MNLTERPQAGPEKEKPAPRKQRWDHGSIQMTTRDLQVLTWIGEQYAARFDQVQNLLSRAGPVRPALYPERLSETRTREIITRWRAAGLVEMDRILHREPAWIWLSSSGLGETSLSYRYLRPKPSVVHHLYYINQVRLMLAKERPEAFWTSERARQRFIVV